MIINAYSQKQPTSIQDKNTLSGQMSTNTLKNSSFSTPLKHIDVLDEPLLTRVNGCCHMSTAYDMCHFGVDMRHSAVDNAENYCCHVSTSVIDVSVINIINKFSF
jgi:hypothetical protein